MEKKILIAPLDWGLGHATRCIPIIQEILSAGHEIIIAADGRAAELLKNEFPQLQHIFLKGYHPKYPIGKNMSLKMLLQTPKFFWRIFKEHNDLKKIIEEYSIDAVISDNRYGLWSNKIPAVIITHQLFIKTPQNLRWLQPLINKLNHFFLRKFKECWVPDFSGEKNMSGDLSHGNVENLNVKFIGLLSRFKKIPSHKKYHLLVLLSGPEPQRTLFEKKCFQQLKNLNLNALIVQGMPEKNEQCCEKNIKNVSHLSVNKLNEAMCEAEVILCRAGYSSLMDILALQKKAIIVPTPGQTEQEYLAKRFSKMNWAITQTQNELDISNVFKEAENLNVESINFERSLYKDVIKKWLASL